MSDTIPAGPGKVLLMPGVQPPPGQPVEMIGGLAYEGHKFHSTSLPEREVMAVNVNGEAFFKAHSIVALGAQPGIGKTMASGSIAVAASLGDATFGFQWTKPRRVLTIDMELSAEEAQERYRMELRGREPSENWRLICSDSLDTPLGALYSPEELERLMPLYDWAEVVVIDTASHALPTEDDNSTVAWQPCDNFLLMLRRMNKLVFVTFHLNAAGTRIRGTSAKTQSVDFVGIMKRPEDSEEDGCHFEVKWEKHRGVTREVAMPFESWLNPNGTWTTIFSNENSLREKFLECLRHKMPVKDAAQAMEVNIKTAYKWRSAAKESGLLR